MCIVGICYLYNGHADGHRLTMSRQRHAIDTHIDSILGQTLLGRPRNRSGRPLHKQTVGTDSMLTKFGDNF